MMRVLQLATSTPVSMMVVHTSTSMLPSNSWAQTEESSRSPILPWATATLASGAICRTREAQASMDSTRL